jgi:hypothetical protein
MVHRLVGFLALFADDLPLYSYIYVTRNFNGNKANPFESFVGFCVSKVAFLLYYNLLWKAHPIAFLLYLVWFSIAGVGNAQGSG